MKIGEWITARSTDHPRTVTALMLAATLLIGVLAALPTIWPNRFSALPPLKVDTDPENMLTADEPVRVFHNRMKETFSLNDIVVVGVVNERDPDGVFNPESLKRINELTRFARTLQWDDPKAPRGRAGVVAVDLIAPSTVDNIEQAGPGTVSFEWLMPEPPQTREEAREIRRKAERIPFLKGTLLSENGKALCLYLPLTSKDVSYRVYDRLNRKIAEFDGEERFYITGLPVANDTFGVEMFKQMAISAPTAMAVIFLLMFLFFRKLVLICSPMILAVVSVVLTMGLLIVTGNTVHIMSSMIPIFIMPIAVLDSIHILSEFFDRYPRVRDRRRTILEVMDELFMPMLYTSLTSMAGFASLALTPIPPVQVFGIFVAFGVMTAWLLTVTFIPAFVMFIPETSLAGFGSREAHGGETGLLSRMLVKTGKMTYHRAKAIMGVVFAVIVVAGWGISLIRINDNPVKWFTRSHPIRVADRELNKHFGGTYMAYLEMESGQTGFEPGKWLEEFRGRSVAWKKDAGDFDGIDEAFSSLLGRAASLVERGIEREVLFEDLDAFVSEKVDAAPDEAWDAWQETAAFLETEKKRGEIFKQPEVLRYVAKLQDHLLTTGVVGKSNSLADVVKTVYRELLGGEKEHFRVPDTTSAVAQCLLTYQNSHRPQDLWHFVTPDYEKTSLWVQLKSGNNRDMSGVIRSVDRFFRENPPPGGLVHRWFGLTYINVVWQQKMVAGMLKAFMGSFLVVFLMMTLLFRSALWGILSMVPLTVTIVFIYGAVGIVGKDYDMPIAVLSSLTLGLAVDFAIHFLARARETAARTGSWKDAAGPMFDEPARAISRNIIVIAVGFIPLLAAPLVPYKTVGAFLATILAVAGLATLFILPALLRLGEKRLFDPEAKGPLTCRCVTCLLTAVTAVAVVVLNFQEYLNMGWTALAGVSLAAVLLSAGLCAGLSRRRSCRITDGGGESPPTDKQGGQ